MEKGAKVDEFSHIPYDQKQRYVPLPKMGASVDKKYDQLIDNYFSKKEIKKLRQEVEEYNQH